jgi:hypothetical protein
MNARPYLLAALLVLGTLAFAPVAPTASASHVCVTEPCDGHFEFVCRALESLGIHFIDLMVCNL